MARPFASDCFHGGKKKLQLPNLEKGILQNNYNYNDVNGEDEDDDYTKMKIFYRDGI